MKLDEIYIKLKPYSPEIHKYGDCPQELISCMLATDYTKNYNKDILYVIYASTLKTIDIPNNLSMIIIKDIQIDYDALSCKKISYIEISEQHNIFHVFDNVQNLFTTNIKLISSTSTLLNTLIKNKGLKYIVEIASSILNNPVVLIDTSFKILSHSVKSTLDDVYWNENIQKGYCPYDFVKVVEQTKIIDNVIENSKPLVVDCFRSNIRKIVGKIVIDGRIVGYTVVLELEKEFIQEDVEITNIICDVISEEIKKNSSYISLKGIVYENLILDLLENRIDSKETLIDRMKTADCKLGTNLRLMTIYNSEQQFNKHFNGFILNYIKQLIPNSISILYNDNIVSIIDMKNEDKPSSFIKDSLTSFLLENRLKAGISSLFSDMLNLKKYYIQSIKCLELSSLLAVEDNKGSHVYFYDDYRFYHMLNVNKDLNMLEFCRPELYKLLDYDKINNTDYFNDLYCYLKNNCNIKATSDQLFVHRNTMSYRVQKISEMLNLDLTSGDIVFQLNFSYRVFKYVGSIDDNGIL